MRKGRRRRTWSILFIDELHTVMAGQGGSGIGAGDLLKPALARGKLRTIGATTLNEYRQVSFILSSFPSALSRRSMIADTTYIQ